MNSTRLQRMMQRQLEVERKLREKETQRLAQEEAKCATRAEEVRKECIELERNQELFHKRDEKLRGYRGASSHTEAVAVHTVPDEGVSETQNSRKSGGSEWTKTSVGWLRNEMRGKTYKQPCTKDSLPAWLYDELDIIFGMRRIYSYDFILATFVLDHLFKQYIGKDETSKQVQKRIILDTQMAIARMKTNPGCEMASQALIPALAILGNLELEITKLNPQSSCTEPQEIPIPLDDQGAYEHNINATLPEEVMLHIFSYLFSPQDLAKAANVCVNWSSLANDNLLLQHSINHLCKFTLGVEVPDSPMPKRELFLHLWTRKKVPMSGLYQCKTCKELYWAAKKSLCPGGDEYRSKYHVGGEVDIDNLIPTLTGRIQYF